MDWKEFLKLSLKNTTIQFIIIFYIILFFLFFIASLFHPIVIAIIIVFSGIVGLGIIFGGGLTFKSGWIRRKDERGWTYIIFEFTRNSIERKLIFFFVGLFFELIGGGLILLFMIGLPLACLGFAMLCGVFYNILDKKRISSFLLGFILFIPILVGPFIFSLSYF
jgi:hypothetical protein